ncbi:right-handed parallel beta-helix repeat-containing protein, partial [bacterium]|nr:right-handed parallel beta-helix repeat-containing protein [bacterium]
MTRRPRARLGLEGLDDRLAPAVLTVNSILDTANPADGYLTLRQAIGIVNSPTLPGGLSEEIQDQISGTLHGGGVDTIVFDPSLVTAPIVLTGGALELTVDSDVSRVTVDGGDGVTVDANLASRVFIIEIGSWASFTNLTIANGNFEAPALSPGGGGILNAGTLTITDSTFSGNITSAFDGGGGGAIANTESGVLTIIDSTFTGNIADDSSDGGSGLYNLGTATVVGSTFVENGGPNAVNGGAIAVIGGHVGVLNSTFSGNQASYGSAIFVRYATATIISSTFANNDDTGFGANAVIYIQGATTVLNSVFSANTAGGAPGAAIFDATSGSLATTAGNIESVTAVLAPLANNGGPTQTHAPLGGSPAIAAGVAPTTVAGLTDMLTPIIAVADATRLVLIPNVSVILIDGEQMLVTAVNGNMLTVTRGFNGTLRAPHTLTAGVYPAFDQRGMPRLINGAIDAGATQMRPLTVTGPVTPQTVNASAVTVAGTVPAADSLVQVYKDVNNNGVIDVGDDLVASQQLTGGATTYSVAVPLDRNAVNNFLVTATPPLGSVSAPADVPTVIEDSAPPNTPVVSGPATPVEVNAAAYTITGTAEADSLVTVYVDADNSGTLTAGDTIAGTQQLTGGATAYSITVPLAQD